MEDEMQQELALNGSDVTTRAISPFREMGAYEALWTRPKTTFKSLSNTFAQYPGSVPSDFVSNDEAYNCAKFVMQRFTEAKVGKFGVRVHGAGEYPQQLRDATYPIELIYYQGWWDLVSSRSVAVIGTRKPSKEGLSRTRQIVRELVRNNFTVVSGLAAGIDTMAHRSAIQEDGRTIAVIGTPLSHTYPKENTELQHFISKNHLIVSQVPVKRYELQDYRYNRSFFPERNITMSALTEATIIVEAGETSGTQLQARAAIKQKRKLFILDSCFRNIHITWPEKYVEKGAYRVKNYDDLQKHLST